MLLETEQWFYGSTGDKVPYLAFTDNPIIFIRCSKGCLMDVRAFLESYQSYSGQKINVSKSSFVCSPRVMAEHLSMVSSIL